MIFQGIKIIFVDLDWTILNHGIHDWDHKSIEGLKEAQKKGVLVYLCTARPYDSVVHTGLFSLFTPDGVICTNGGVVFVGEELLYANVIPPDVVRQIEKVSNRHHFVLEIGTDKERYFTCKPNSWVKKFFSSYSDTIPDIRHYQNENVTSILLFTIPKHDEKMKKEYPPEIRYVRFDEYGVDLCYHKNNKGIAVKKVLEHLGISKSHSMSFGDDNVDIPMFENTGISIALANGKPDAIKAATDTTCHIDDHGIFEALKKYKVI
jgi:Cof subfamily protein (haloacid dehalogenase superfamily)